MLDSPAFASGVECGCLICGGKLRPSRLPGLVRCVGCGFVTTQIDISDAELNVLYGRDYFHGQEYLDYAAEADSLRTNFKRRLKVLNGVYPGLATAELFEIGCAYGFFLQEASSHVVKASGIDISVDAVKRATDDLNVDARVADYLSLELAQPVDLIAMWDTIEHLRRPDLFISKASRDLKSGGQIAITTGDIDSLNARLRGKSWRMIHPPTHLHYFSVATLGRLLDRNGFDVVHVSHPGNARKLRSVLYSLTKLKGNAPDVYDRLQSLSVFDRNITVNLYDIMYMVGRKRPETNTETQA
jgi:SAM-dependent methyltransferase